VLFSSTPLKQILVSCNSLLLFSEGVKRSSTGVLNGSGGVSTPTVFPSLSIMISSFFSMGAAETTAEFAFL
jgi:hypothetical protein